MSMMRPYLTSLVALAASVAGGGSTPTTPTTRPNILMLFMDDHGWGDFGANWNATTETPNLDRLAADGIRFTDFHVGASVCTPSRATLLTGRYGLRTGVHGNFGPTSLHGMGATELTMANVLSDAGYSTHMIGKWHLGHNEPFHPTFRGFESWFGLPYSGDMGCLDSRPQSCFPDFDNTKGSPACPARCLPDNATSGAEVAIPLYDTNGTKCAGKKCWQTIVEQPFNPFALNSRYAARASGLIAEHAHANRQHAATVADKKPMFLYVAFAHTHTPLAYEPAFDNASSRPGELKVFGNTLAEVDHAIGVIRSAVDAEANDESWLVWVTADNGPADLASVACEAIGSPGPYVGAWVRTHGGGGGSCKSTTWEGGHRELGIAYWQHVIQPGVSHVLSHTLDLMPTFASRAGADLTQYGRVFDGMDLSPLLLNGDDAPYRNRVIFHQDGGAELTAMRLGKYKAFFETAGSGGGGCRYANGTHRWQPATSKRMSHNPPLVFDLDKDPGESTPIKVSDAIYRQLAAAQSAKLYNISNTMRSETNYSEGGTAAWACSNHSSAVCRYYDSPYNP
eukprot:m.256064 g.256064  ORF g.256064 m.256064 type:complete len:566 (+) comp19624_c1_seq6:78-1775(+)